MAATTQQPQQGYTRLEVELEFVQCLANPFYLNYLAHSKVLDDERFINYIGYLEYFREPLYSKLLTYPVYSLAALTLLKQPQFRADIANPAVAHEMMQEMVVSLLPPENGGKETGIIDTTNGANNQEQFNGASGR